MRATYWTAIGAMLIPTGVVILIEAPSFSSLAVFLTLVGVASFVAGWLYTIKEEHQMLKESEARTEREKARTKREKASLIVLVYMADELGVDMSEVVKDEEMRLDEQDD